MPSCLEPGCEHPAKGRGLCRTHYAYRRRHGTLPPLVLKSASGCGVPGCQRPYEAHGLCATHLRRQQKTGSLATPVRSLPPEERFWAKVDRSGGPSACWPRGDKNEYTTVWWEGRTQLAHRVAYKLTVGPIPDGHTIDHVKERGCVLKSCCNPAHLEAVTLRVNILRGDAPSVVTARTRVCKRGHPQTPENVYVHVKRGRRHCKVCQRERERNKR